MPGHTRFMTREQIVAQLVAEFEAKREPMTISFDPYAALYVAGLMRMAMKLPPAMVSAQGREAGEQFFGQLCAYFADCPTALDVLGTLDPLAGEVIQ